MSKRTRALSLRRAVLAACLAMAAAIAPVVVAPVPAQAAPVTGFNPGNIIDDSLFYNGNAMNASEIQSFLNQRLSSCRIGTPGYMPGSLSPSGSGNIIANNCLKDFRQTTTSQPADRYCGAYAGATNETSAQIIEKVGRACGISQKVLLVMLEKEQSLLTDDWPVTRQYNYALGMNCPDSGPNNSANCDAASAGFSKQLYLGARQLKVYLGNPSWFNYEPFRYNTIQWHPNTSCGTSQVYIENWATAALYIYTPYRPNQAALNAGWGSGDSCSTYGNRNFFLFYSQWFGAGSGGPSIPVHAQFKALFEQSGGTSGSLGRPMLEARTLPTGAIEQRFESETLYWSQQSGLSSVRGAIRTLYEATGGPAGLFGLPSGREITEHGWVRQDFQGGTGYWTGTSGAGLIRGGIRTQYLAHAGVGGLSGANGYLGTPIGLEEKQGDGVVQRFQKGMMFWHPVLKETWTRGGIASEHNRLEGVSGRLGFPLGPERDGGGYAVQNFERGNIYWSSQRGARGLFGAMFKRFEAEGGADGVFGIPLSGESAVGEGVRQDFERVTAYYRSDLGVSYVFGGIRSTYLSEGGPAGYLGFPLGVEVTEDGWARQEFEKGDLFWSAETSTVQVRGGIRDAYLAAGSYAGVNGYPLTSELSENGGVRQEYQSATAYWSPSSRAGFVRGTIRDEYRKLGGSKSFLGFPVGTERSIDAWVRQDFDKGIAYWSEATGVVFVRGGILKEFLASNAEAGTLGYPLTSEISEPGGVRQEYERATVRWSAATGVTVAPK